MAKKIKMRLVYDSPFTCIFVLVCTAVLCASYFVSEEACMASFSAPTRPGGNYAFNWMRAFDYLRLFIHILYHRSAAVFASYTAVILLAGPVLEKRYGSLNLFIMVSACAFVTGVCSAVFSPSPMYGAAGIVLLLIILYSFAYAKKEGLYFTNILLFVLPLFGVLLDLSAPAAAPFAAVHKDISVRYPAVLMYCAGAVCGSLFAFAAVPLPARVSRSSR